MTEMKCLLCGEGFGEYGKTSHIAIGVKLHPNERWDVIGWIHSEHLEDFPINEYGSLGSYVKAIIKKALYDEWNKPAEIEK